MNQPRNNALLCPGCRKLISRDVPACPHCGLAHPGSSWKANWWTQKLLSADGLIKAIIYTNVGFYVLALLLDPRGFSFSMNPLNFLSPASNSLFILGATGRYPIDQIWPNITGLPGVGWLTLITANFLHGSLLHILFNMLVLRQLGQLTITEFGIYRMLIIYLTSGVGGFYLSYLAGVPFTIGASAAVCGLIGALIYFGKARGGVYGNMVYRQIGGWAIGLIIIGFLPGINNWGHAGGFLTGIGVAFLVGYQERRPETFAHKAIAGVGTLVTLAVLAASAGFAVFYTISV
jgi:rhomboid protease GluP